MLFSSSKTRSKVIQKLKDPHKQRFVDLNQALASKTSSEVIDLVEKASESFEMSLSNKKNANDTKREKEISLQLRESTKAALESEKDPATILHLTCTLLYYYATNHMLNAPGRCVPNILEALRSGIKEETFDKLIGFQSESIYIYYQ